MEGAFFLVSATMAFVDFGGLRDGDDPFVLSDHIYIIERSSLPATE
jgi:hypothetical protein